ncbi:hypothetical protein DCAR_0102874 [Daucus carota subsp. sativus]|uniref:Gnk2-homologous domain-containing protein n=1 Tax=Daucus carota subsp. sativus TaxID=79200 RepID=A0AAF0W633_DAUCS|nr:hypothetical protein DCAR_0102874 [Daucus carota subsp. sativus]
MGYANISLRGLVLLGLSCTVARSDPRTTVKSVLCNSGVYTKVDLFAISLAYIIALGYDYKNISPYPNAFAYGHAACSTNLTTSDCSTCLGAAKTAMFGTCVIRIGARAVLFDCTIRYENTLLMTELNNLAFINMLS